MNKKKCFAITISFLFLCSFSYISLSSAITINNNEDEFTEVNIELEIINPNNPRTSQTTAWSANGTIVCDAANDQEYPQMCSDGAGGAFIVWEDNRHGDFDVFALRIDSNGNLHGNANGTNLYHDVYFDDQENPQICFDGNGNAIIVYEDENAGDPYNHDIMAQKINSNGLVQWGIYGKEICGESNMQINPQICCDGSEGAIITWMDNRSGTWDIYAQKIDSNGAFPWGDDDGTLIDTDPVGDDQINPQICCDGNGNAIITYEDEWANRDYDHNIKAQKINSNGVIQWGSTGKFICDNNQQQNNPKICCDGSGGAIITWLDNRTDPDFDVYAQKINSSGGFPWGVNDGTVICNATDIQEDLQLCCDRKGGAIMTWEDERSDNGDIYAQKVNLLGETMWDDNGTVICNATGGQYDPQPCCDGSGGAVITWEDYRKWNYDIYAQKINSNKKTMWNDNGIVISEGTGSQTHQQVCYSSGNIIITWDDDRSGEEDIYAQKITEGGGLDLLLLFLLAMPTSREPIPSYPPTLIIFTTLISIISIITIFWKKKGINLF